MSSGWAFFRQKWFRPEVYPLIGAMGTAVGFSVFAIYNKTRDSNITWAKSRRLNDPAIATIDEYEPLLTSTKGNSTRVFGTDRTIFESQYKNIETEPMKFTIHVGDPDEEEEIEEAAAEASEVDEEAANENEESIKPTKKVDPENVEQKDPELIGDEEAAEEVLGTGESETDASDGNSDGSDSVLPDFSTMKEDTEAMAQAAVDAALNVLVSDEEKEHAEKTPAGSTPANTPSSVPPVS